MKNIFFYISLLFFTQPAQAYLDPGTSSIILQSLIVFMAAALGFISVSWKKIKNFLLKFKKKPNNKKNEKTL